MNTDSSTSAREAEHQATLAFLAVRGVGPSTCGALRQKFGSLAAALEAGPDAYLACLRGDAVADHRAQPDLAGRAEQMRVACEKQRASILFRDEPGWPARLRELGAQQPEVIFVRGRLELGLRTAGVVGTRKPSSTGLRAAERLGEVLAQSGHVTVSGGAAGVDTAAHQGSLDARGQTWAVLGAGLAHPFPRENVRLFERIAEQGALITEFPPEHEVKEGNFHRRNKLVAALSEALVVVEGDKNSGAMITAGEALTLGRPLLAVPGDVMAKVAQGPNALLREGKARFCWEARDVLEALGDGRSPRVDGAWGASVQPSAPRTTEQPLDKTLEPIFRALGPAPRHFDELAGSVQCSVPALASALTQLELLGLCEQRPGKFFVRRSG